MCVCMYQDKRHTNTTHHPFCLGCFFWKKSIHVRRRERRVVVYAVYMHARRGQWEVGNSQMRINDWKGRRRKLVRSDMSKMKESMWRDRTRNGHSPSTAVQYTTETHIKEPETFCNLQKMVRQCRWWMVVCKYSHMILLLAAVVSTATPFFTGVSVCVRVCVEKKWVTL
jgi:hypothetical protein